MSGPPQKPEDERVRRNSYAPRTTLRWDGKTRGPELPLGLPGVKWCTQTIKFWEKWRNSAQATVMTDTDWEEMLIIAVLHNRFWSPRREAVTGKNGKVIKKLVPMPVAELKVLAGEMRMRLEKFGATPKDRHVTGMVVPTDADDLRTKVTIEEEAETVVNYFDELNAEVARQQESKKGK